VLSVVLDTNQREAKGHIKHVIIIRVELASQMLRKGNREKGQQFQESL
jgi:hypothetical protein